MSSLESSDTPKFPPLEGVRLQPVEPLVPQEPVAPDVAAPAESVAPSGPLSQNDTLPPLQPLAPVEPLVGGEELQPLQPTMPPAFPAPPSLSPSDVPTPPAAPPRTEEEIANLGVPLGTLIFRAGLLTEEQLEDALQEGVRTGKRLGEVLVEGGLLNERDLGRLLAGQKGLRFVDLGSVQIDPAAVALLPAEKARMHVALPVGFDGGVPLVAVADPSNELVLENLSRTLGSEPRLVVASRSDLLAAIDRVHLPPVPEQPVVAEPVAAEPVVAEQPHQFEPAPPGEPAPTPVAAFDPPAPAEPLVPEVTEAPPPAPPTEPVAAEVFAAQPPVAETPAVEPPQPVDVSASPPPTVELPVAEPVTVAPPAPEPAPAAPVAPAPPAPVEPEPVFLPPPPVEPTFDRVEPEPEPQPEQHDEGELPTALSYDVSLRLSDGERVQIGSFGDPQKAREYARDVVRHLSDDAEGWPFFSGRFMRPDTIVSVDIVPVGEPDRWLGSTIRANWASRLNR